MCGTSDALIIGDVAVVVIIIITPVLLPHPYPRRAEPSRDLVGMGPVKWWSVRG